MKRLLSVILITVSLLLVVSLDAGFFPALGDFWSKMSTLLMTSLYLIIIFRNSLAYTFFVVATVFYSLSVSNLLFTPLISGLITLAIINFLLERFFTNRSYYVLIVLGAFGWFFYHLLYGLLLILLRLWSPESLVISITYKWFTDIFLLSFIVVAFLSVGYLLTNSMSKRFKSYFIISND